VRPLRLLERGGESALAPFPLLVRADPLRGAQPERDFDVRETERPVDGVRELEEAEDLVLDVLERA
jgi:hypothetical protein